MRYRIDAAHDALGRVENGLDGWLCEKRAVQTCDLQAVFQIRPGGVAVEAAQVVADGNALGQCLQVRKVHDLAEPGLAREEHGQSAGAVPLEIRQKWKQAEYIRP